MSVQTCFRCNEIYPSDDMTPDGFGDSHVQLCDSCMFEIRKDNSQYILVKTPEYSGTTFVLKQYLDELIEEYGENEVEVLT